MPDTDKIEEFLDKLKPCIDKGELDVCVDEAKKLAEEMGIGAEEIFNLCIDMGGKKKKNYAYVLAIIAARDTGSENKDAAYCNAGLTAYNIGKIREAEENYLKSLEINPKHAITQNNYAILLDKLNRKEEAEKHYKEAIKLNPDFAEAEFNLALLFEKLNRKYEAKEHYERAIEINPFDAAEHNNYANLLSELDRKTYAEKHYKKAIEIDPEYTLAHNNYANLLRKTNRSYEAEKEVKIALNIDYKEPYSLGTLGDILADEDCLEEAIEEYKKAIKNSALMEYSALSEIYNNLGLAYANLKRYGDAKKQFQKALAVDTMNIKAARNLRVLGKVRDKTPISKSQICVSILLFIPLVGSYCLFLAERLSETGFVAQSTFLISLLTFIIFYHQLARVKIGAIEFEKSEEHRLREAKNQPAEAISKMERF